jgi:hypothetical protein
MGSYRNISIAIFLAMTASLVVMAFTGSFWTIVALVGLMPMLVAIQVWAVLWGNEEAPSPEGRDLEDRWYENR